DLPRKGLRRHGRERVHDEGLGAPDWSQPDVAHDRGLPGQGRREPEKGDWLKPEWSRIGIICPVSPDRRSPGLQGSGHFCSFAGTAFNIACFAIIGTGWLPVGLIGMSEELDTARRYRLHAEELRAIASEMTTPEIRTKVLSLVFDYERMAKTMEE